MQILRASLASNLNGRPPTCGTKWLVIDRDMIENHHEAVGQKTYGSFTIGRDFVDAGRSGVTRIHG